MRYFPPFRPKRFCGKGSLWIRNLTHMYTHTVRVYKHPHMLTHWSKTGSFSSSHWNHLTTAASQPSMLQEQNIWSYLHAPTKYLLMTMGAITLKVLYLMRKGHASMTQSVTSINRTPAAEKGGQMQTMWLRMAAASSSFRYI